MLGALERLHAATGRTEIVIDYRSIALALDEVGRQEKVSHALAVSLARKLQAVIDVPGSVPGWRLERVEHRSLRVRAVRIPPSGLAGLVVAAQ